MNQVIAVRRFEATDAPAAVAIIQGLPDYFTADVPSPGARSSERHIPCGGSA